MAAITIYLRDNLYSFCLQKAEKENITINDFIRKLVIKELKQENKHE